MTDSHPPVLAVSTVIFALRPDAESGFMTLWLPLVRRTRDPHLGLWALPGGWLPPEEELSAAAASTLRETTGLSPNYLEQLYTFGDLGRSPGSRVVSIVYWALVQSTEAELATVGDNVQWFPADRLPELAFDHNHIVEYALWRLRTKVEYSRIAHAFLGETFWVPIVRHLPSLPCRSIWTCTGARGRTVPETVSERPALTRVVFALAASSGVQPTATPEVALVPEPVTVARARSLPAARQVTGTDQAPSPLVSVRATVTQPLVPCFCTSTRWPAIPLPSPRFSVPETVSSSP